MFPAPGGIVPSDIMALLTQAVDEKLVAAKPQGDLTLYSYTPACQYSKSWNAATSAARGLILVGDRIVARPFVKFFNWSELTEDQQVVRLNQPAHYTEKLDGSLGILYRGKVATRGSFDSEQAQWATEWFNANYPDLAMPEGVTPLVEIIYPSNRIVLDYGERAELVLLTGIDWETGRDVDLSDWWPGTKVKEIDEDALGELPNDGNYEGYVIRYLDDDYRVKVKLDEYVRLHRLVTGTTARTIWEALSAGGGLAEIIDRVPDEFYQWATSVADRIRGEYDEINRQALTDFDRLKPLADISRKDFALEATKTANPALMFLLLDGRPLAEKIWKMLYPVHERPFKTEV